MNGFDFHKICQERLYKYRDYLSYKVYDSAIVELAEIYHCSKWMNDQDRMFWMGCLYQERPNNEVIRIVEDELKQRINQIKHVLSIGSIWNEDETLMILHQRINVDLILDLFQQCYGLNILIDCTEADELIIKTEKTVENKRAYQIAINLMKKNWGMPITSKWLSMPK